MKAFDLETYLSHGVERIVKGILKVSLQNPKESLFLARYALESRRAQEIRRQFAADGEHIPPFLIASIAVQCNLHCKGCYARANHSCCDSLETDSLDSREWGSIFQQAAELGIGFILLAGGEPFLRQDVLAEAGRQKKILFPVFTNGTVIDEPAMCLLSENRNLIPILSIEGSEQTTDERRGAGTYQKLKTAMRRFRKDGILFGASVTVSRENLEEVLSQSFVRKLKQDGCRGIIFVEYVPVDHTLQHLALDDALRVQLMERLNRLREQETDLLLMAFPGDEKQSGGCLAAGRGFFHINAGGGAEPCPFSPYSDTDLRHTSLREALRSPLFRRLQESGNLEQEHIGGCTLFAREEEVRKLLEDASV